MKSFARRRCNFLGLSNICLFLIAICTTRRKKHNKEVAEKKDWLYPEEPKEKDPLQRCVCKVCVKAK